MTPVQYVWQDVFKTASTEKKKMMLSILLEVVYISKDKILVEIKGRLKELLRSSIQREYGNEELNF